MRKRFVNKDFLPKEYINERVIKNSKEEKRGLYILVIIALILLPFSLSSINIKEEVKIESVETTSTNDTNKDEVSFWVSLNSENVKGNVNKNNASLQVDTKEALEKLINNEKISINNIYYLEDDKYKIELTKR